MATAVSFVWTSGYKFFITEGVSMEPTLENGDLIVVNKIFYNYTTIDRLDVVTLNDIEDGGYMVKRIIGMPMEVIEIREGIVYVDGKIANFDYKIKPYRLNVRPTKVPAGCYFYIGDNMGETVWGIIDEADIIGKVQSK
jgi:signal peptidase I|tara:strand:+ start:511 stop:927 length:417 start_codon:yes stop_codon:yes gene_type:complete